MINQYYHDKHTFAYFVVKTKEQNKQLCHEYNFLYRNLNSKRGMLSTIVLKTTTA